MKNIILSIALILILPLFIVGCDNDSNAQLTSTELNMIFSGSFIPAPEKTDTNDDGRPSSLRTYQGQSTFGNSTITIIDEFAEPIAPANCPLNDLEFDLVRGEFVIRVGNGDLLLGTIESGYSCFDPIAGQSEIYEEAILTDGTGQFAGVSGTVVIKTSSIFQNTTAVNGFASGGSTGEVMGTIEIQ
ncbi:MAG: hypothetical protein WBC96_03225 [Thermodesulfobacteriota bacterium]